MGEDSTDVLDKKKTHRERKSGRKAERKKKKQAGDDNLTDRQRNPKAFAFNSAVKAERRFRHKQDIQTKKQHIPLVDRTPLEPPPILVGIVGPPKVGKSTLISSLIKLFTRTNLTDVKGPVTIVTGKKRRITFIECNNDINSMIDLAKVADLILLLCDASFGFEMEVFEFLNICQVHGMPRIMGVLTHLDMIKNSKALKNSKKTLKHRFWAEVYPGAKLFYLSGILHGEYLRNEIKNLGRFISVIKFRPLTWRTTHSYLVGDRYEDLTSQELIRKNPKCDRNISLYGYVRGLPLNKQVSVHIAGLGDLPITDISYLPDPCPLPEAMKKRALIEKEKLIYAPFSGVGGIVYDKDAVYVELGGSHSHKQRDENESSNIVTNLIKAEETLDVKMKHSTLQLFSSGKKLTAEDVENMKKDSEMELEGNPQLYSKTMDKEDEEGTELDEELKNLREKEPEEEYNESNVGGRRKVIFKQNDDEFLKSLPSDESDDSDSEEDDDDDNKDGSIHNEEPKILKGQGHHEIHEKLTQIIKELDKKQIKPKIHKSDSSKIKTSRKVDKLEPDNESGNEDFQESKSDESEDEDFQEPKSEDSSVSEDDQEENLKEGNEEDLDDSEEDIEDGNEEDLESDIEEDLEVKWKDNLAKFALNRQNRTQNLMKIVYGVFDKKFSENLDSNKNEENNVEDEIGGLFRLVHHEKQKNKTDKDNMNEMESSLFESWDATTRNWLDPDNKMLIQNCFVTGVWKNTEDAAELLKLDDAEDIGSDDSEMYGDFEDLETGEKYTTDKKEEVSANQDGKRKRSDEPEDELSEKKKLAEKKRKLKEKFDVEYDNTEKDYYDELKVNAEKQAQLNKTIFENMPDDLRVQIEGYRPGMYVRLEFQDVPAEFVNNFDPTYPLVIGALNMSEENIGFVNVKIRKHRWYKNILKTSDPVIISLGWRRFQTVPLYSKLEDDLKFRYLKYTPEHVTCNAHFWGPVTPQGTGFLALQSCEQNSEVLKQGFRIAATGTVQELDKSTQIMKKLKLIGYPLKIYKKTAFIKGMFSSALEVARFEGAQIKTVSGIRGQIKKAISKPEGCFRATFEDKIQLSDIVFCRTWFKVSVPQFYNPVITLLLPPEQKNAWRGARTTGQIKREEGIRNQANKDSMFTEIVRDPKVFKPLVVPRKLQKALPYRDKPKYGALSSEKKKPIDRVAVVREPHEQKVSHMMKMLRASFEHKQAQLKLATKEKMEKYKRETEEQESRKLRKLQQQKKQVMRVRSKAQMSAKNKSTKR